jgi:hypothetical protein
MCWVDAWQDHGNATVRAQRKGTNPYRITLASSQADPMRYKGLKEWRGVEMYEEDICQSKLYGGKDTKRKTWKAIYDADRGAYYCKARNGIDSPHTHVFSFGRDLEVIGNIYENPELPENTTSTS